MAGQRVNYAYRCINRRCKQFNKPQHFEMLLTAAGLSEKCDRCHHIMKYDGEQLVLPLPLTLEERVAALEEQVAELLTKLEVK